MLMFHFLGDCFIRLIKERLYKLIIKKVDSCSPIILKTKKTHFRTSITNKKKKKKMKEGSLPGLSLFVLLRYEKPYKVSVAQSALFVNLSVPEHQSNHN